MQFGLSKRGDKTEDFSPLKTVVHKEILNAADYLSNILLIEEKFAFVIDNFQEFEFECLGLTLRELNSPDRTHSEGVARIHLLNRKIVNLLTTTRLYFDHTAHHLPSLPNADVLTGEFNCLRREKYDNSLSFRLGETLRNYVQHRGLPLDGAVYTSRWVDLQNFEPHRTAMENGLALYLLTDRLIADKSFKRQVADELKEQPRKLNLRPVIWEYVGDIAAVHNQLRNSTKELVKSSAEMVKRTIDDFAGNNARRRSPIYLVTLENGKIIESRPLMMETSKRITELVSKYSRLENLTKQFVTSLPPDKI
jgi:hypothetical protein